VNTSWFSKSKRAFLICVVLFEATNCSSDKAFEDEALPILDIAAVNCNSASAACMYNLTLKDNLNQSTTVKYYSNYNFTSNNRYNPSDIKQLVVVIHGTNRNAGDYFNFIMSSIIKSDLSESTLVISPLLTNKIEANIDNLYWENNEWRSGANSSNPNSNVSSFTVIDQIIQQIEGTNQFLNLNTILVIGHSSGAAFVQLYALVNEIETKLQTINFNYAIANNQYYFYPTDQRYDELNKRYYIPSSCSNFNAWPYGYDQIPDYLKNTNKETITQNQVRRNTTYLIGTNNVLTSGTLNTQDCAAVLLGSNRFNRGLNIYNYMQHFFPEINQHQKINIEGVGHNASEMFNSPAFQSYLLNLFNK
jgi:hypothetical protein